MPCLNGHPTPADASFCPTCGAAASMSTSTQYPTAPPPQAPAAYPAVPSWPATPVPYPQSYPVPYAGAMPAPRTLYTVAAIINWVVLGLIIVGTFGIGIICAAWFVPMTIQMHKGSKDPYKHTSLGVCTLLFCNIVSGILLLVDDSGKQDKPIQGMG